MKDNIRDLYDAYPILKRIDNINNNIITSGGIFKELLADELLASYGSGCSGFLFVLSGDINIQKIGIEGEETNLYNIGRGELCHEALSCFLRSEPLNVLGKATQTSKIFILPFDIADRYLLSNNEFLKNIYKDLHEKFNLIIGNKEAVKHESLKTRVLKLLISKESKIIYATHSELAFELDSAREVISRKLKELEKDGYLKLTRGKIQIVKDLKELL